MKHILALKTGTAVEEKYSDSNETRKQEGITILIFDLRLQSKTNQER